MFIIEIRVTGLDHAQQVLRQIQSLGAHRNLMVFVAGLVERQTKKRLAEEKRAPDGSAWASWSASYARRRPRGAGLMVDTGRLLGSISSSVNSDSVLVGTNVFYGAFHQTGTRNQATDMTPVETLEPRSHYKMELPVQACSGRR